MRAFWAWILRLFLKWDLAWQPYERLSWDDWVKRANLDFDEAKAQMGMLDAEIAALPDGMEKTVEVNKVLPDGTKVRTKVTIRKGPGQ